MVVVTINTSVSSVILDYLLSLEPHFSFPHPLPTSGCCHSHHIKPTPFLTIYLPASPLCNTQNPPLFSLHFCLYNHNFSTSHNTLHFSASPLFPFPGMASTVRRDTSAGRKVGLIAARRTGRLTGAKNKGDK